VWGVRVERGQATERKVEGMTAMASFSLFFFVDSSPFLFKTNTVGGSNHYFRGHSLLPIRSREILL
jgi:hypothetical protein